MRNFLKNELTELDENWKTHQQNTETAIYPGAPVIYVRQASIKVE